jgi:flagellar basal-body rod protein FlgB
MVLTEPAHRRGFPMEAGGAGLFDLLIRKMSYLNQAQNVHAQNLANANTPGYKPLEVAPFTFGDAMRQANVGMTVTDARHITPVSMAGANKIAVHPKGSANDTGDVEQEASKVSETGIEYSMITSIYHKMAGLFKIALKGSA